MESPLTHHVFPGILHDKQLTLLLYCELYKHLHFIRVLVYDLPIPCSQLRLLMQLSFILTHRMLETFNHHLNHICKFTRITGKTLRNHFDVIYISLTLSVSLYIHDTGIGALCVVINHYTAWLYM